MKFQSMIIGAALLLFTACPDELQQVDNLVDSNTTPLNISVITSSTKAQITSALLPKEAQLGVFVTKSDGSDYLAGDSYNNILYTGSGVSYAESWTVDPATPVFLNPERATAYAYYPRQASGVSLTAIPITNDGSDWMYSAPVTNLNNQNATAGFDLQHAMSIIRIKVERAKASDFGTVSKVTLDGTGWATGATLNLKEGNIGSFTGVGSQLVTEDLGELSATPLSVEHWVVPTGNATDMLFKVTVDGKVYRSSLSGVTLEAGNVYNYKLTVGNTVGMVVNSISSSSWYEQATQEMKSLSLADLMKEKFQGVTEDGVYAVKEDGTPVAYADATDASYAAVAFVLNGKAYQVAITNAVGYEGNNYVFWWRFDYQGIENLTDYSSLDGVPDRILGYLSGSETPQLSKDHTLWDAGALSDFNGRENTRLILSSQSNGTIDYTIGKAIIEFRENDTINGGLTDWFAPALGELAFMYLNKDQIDDLLKKVSGDTMQGTCYWSSSEYDDSKAWYVHFWSSEVGEDPKAAFHTLRPIREI